MTTTSTAWGVQPLPDISCPIPQPLTRDTARAAWKQVKKEMPNIPQPAQFREAARRLNADYTEFRRAFNLRVGETLKPKTDIRGAAKKVPAKTAEVAESKSALPDYLQRWTEEITGKEVMYRTESGHRVFFSDIRNSSLEQRRRVMHEIDDIMRRMPNREDRLYTWVWDDLHEEGTGGSTTIGGFIIELNSKELSKKVYKPNSPGWLMQRATTPDEALRYTIAHEYGHTWEWGNLTDAQIAFGKRNKAHLSEYAQENYHEAFAEAFADWYLSGGKSANPATQDYAARFGWRLA